MPVITGLQNLLTNQLHRLDGKRVGLVTNPTGVTSDLTLNLDALLAAGVRVTALFGPEHGIRASAADGVAVASSRDAKTGLPIHSLYGATQKPTAEMARDVDVFVYDIQDVGARFYTYIWTLSHVMEAAAQLGAAVMVLDRPNPLGGVHIEGGLLNPGYASLVGRWPIPWCYGLTIGELAGWFNRRVGCDLTVIPMLGWRRELWYDQTSLPWVPPSPGMPTLGTATVYPGTCLFEGTNLSEGRGTAMPFEWIGAPWLDSEAWSSLLNDLGLPGARFRPVAFQPTAGKYTGQECYGVQVHVLDRNAYRPVRTGLHLLSTARRIAAGRFGWLSHDWDGRPAQIEHVDLLAGDSTVREAVDAGLPVSEVEERWAPGLQFFGADRRRHLLYS
jgi:uncharacterized protein YbbC (DUF1343 family)